MIRKGGTRKSVDIVLDKNIFSNVFGKDIRRVYLYKKSERIAKAVHLILPAFKDARALKERLECVAIGLIDASLLGPREARETLSRELLSLASLLSLAKASGSLSSMNVDIITREAQRLLEEIAGYEDRQVSLEEAPTLAGLLRETPGTRASSRPRPAAPASVLEYRTDAARKHNASFKEDKRHDTSANQKSDRKEKILSLVASKGSASIKDISLMMPGVSEKTVQRELQALVSLGRVRKSGERRWTTYTLAVSSRAAGEG